MAYDIIKLQDKLALLKIKHNELVNEEFRTEDEIFENELEGKSTTRLENKLNTILNKCYDNTDKQEELKRLIKNSKAKVKRDLAKIKNVSKKKAYSY